MGCRALHRRPSRQRCARTPHPLWTGRASYQSRTSRSRPSRRQLIAPPQSTCGQARPDLADTLAPAPQIAEPQRATRSRRCSIDIGSISPLPWAGRLLAECRPRDRRGGAKRQLGPGSTTGHRRLGIAGPWTTVDGRFAQCRAIAGDSVGPVRVSHPLPLGDADGPWPPSASSLRRHDGSEHPGRAKEKWSAPPSHRLDRHPSAAQRGCWSLGVPPRRPGVRSAPRPTPRTGRRPPPTPGPAHPREAEPLQPLVFAERGTSPILRPKSAQNHGSFGRAIGPPFGRSRISRPPARAYAWIAGGASAAGSCLEQESR